MPAAGTEQVLTFGDAGQWEEWLASHFDHSDGAFVKVKRKGATTHSITASEAGDVALCYGWIDSIRRSLDGEHFLQRYSPRRPQSPWSQLNVERAEALLAAGRMQAPGLAEVAAARTDGRWEMAYRSQKRYAMPRELESALSANEAARESFEQLGRTAQYLLVLPLLKARTARVRATRLRKIIESLDAVPRA